MVVSQDNFTPMKGHVVDGCQVLLNRGDSVTIKSGTRGWVILAENGVPIKYCEFNASQVEDFIVNGL